MLRQCKLKEVVEAYIYWVYIREGLKRKETASAKQLQINQRAILIKIPQIASWDGLHFALCASLCWPFHFLQLYGYPREETGISSVSSKWHDTCGGISENYLLDKLLTLLSLKASDNISLIAPCRHVTKPCNNHVFVIYMCSSNPTPSILICFQSGRFFFFCFDLFCLDFFF